MTKRFGHQRLTCGSSDHTVHRRLFLQGSMAAGIASVASFNGLFSIPAIAEETKKAGKKCILLWLCGAPSQFETWDPKPGTETGGPFAAINTNLPDIQISSLMPKSRSNLGNSIVRCRNSCCLIPAQKEMNSRRSRPVTGPDGWVLNTARFAPAVTIRFPTSTGSMRSPRPTTKTAKRSEVSLVASTKTTDEAQPPHHTMPPSIVSKD